MLYLTQPCLLKIFLLIFNYKTLIITVLALVSTYICYHHDPLAMLNPFDQIGKDDICIEETEIIALIK